MMGDSHEKTLTDVQKLLDQTTELLGYLENPAYRKTILDELAFSIEGLEVLKNTYKQSRNHKFVEELGIEQLRAKDIILKYTSTEAGAT